MKKFLFSLLIISIFLSACNNSCSGLSKKQKQLIDEKIENSNSKFNYQYILIDDEIIQNYISDEHAKKYSNAPNYFKYATEAILEMRRHLSCYFKGLPDFKETRLKLVTINDPAELFSTLDYIAERWGNNEAPQASNIYNV